MKRSVTCTLSALSVAVATTALVLSPAACSPIGCFEASRSGGTCPAQEEAIRYFDDPECGGTVESVDSEASISNGKPGEGTLCCYSITTKDPEFTDCPDF